MSLRSPPSQTFISRRHPVTKHPAPSSSSRTSTRLSTWQRRSAVKGSNRRKLESATIETNIRRNGKSSFHALRPKKKKRKARFCGGARPKYRQEPAGSFKEDPDLVARARPRRVGWSYAGQARFNRRISPPRLTWKRRKLPDHFVRLFNTVRPRPDQAPANGMDHPDVRATGPSGLEHHCYGRRRASRCLAT